MRLRALLAALLIFASCPFTAALAAGNHSRIALVIGNAKYPDAETPLKEPINDARALTASGAAFADVKHASEDWHDYDFGNKGPLAKPVDLIEDLNTVLEDLASIISADYTSTLGTVSVEDVLDYLGTDYHAETFDRVPIKKALADLQAAAEDTTAAISSGDSKTIRESGIVVEAAARAVQVAQARFDRGVSTYLDVTDAQRSALAADRAAALIRTQRLLAAVSVARALGGGWQQGAAEATVAQASR